MIPMKSTQDKAIQNPTSHQFIPGLGYIDHGEEVVERETVVQETPEPRETVVIAEGHHRHGEEVGGKRMLPAFKACRPGPKAKEESLHNLTNAYGTNTVMRWRGGAWWHPTSIRAGNRMAWGPEYFGKQGWTYKGPAK